MPYAFNPLSGKFDFYHDALLFTTAAITYAATTNLDFAVLTPATYNVLTLTGNVTFTLSNITAGRELRIIVEAGAAQRTLGFPAGLVFGGTKPATIAANKRGFLTIACHGTTEASCSAAWAVQP